MINISRLFGRQAASNAWEYEKCSERQVCDRAKERTLMRRKKRICLSAVSS